MAHIYVITNNINNKKYVGKTADTVEERFRQHKKDACKRKYENRPLYRAMNKYGIENFSIKEIEECSLENLSEREIYWINNLNTYKNGYNATIGGDGKILYDYNKILKIYNIVGSQRETARIIGCDRDTVKRALNENNIVPRTRQQVLVSNYGQKCVGIKDNIKIGPFDSHAEAAKWIKENNSTSAEINSIATNIGRVVSGHRKSAYGYSWVNEE